MATILLIFLRLSVVHVAPPPPVSHPGVLVLDLSVPAGDESPFPEISKKGSL